MTSPARSRARRRIHVGCSGWNYDSWKDTFYPPQLPARRWLRHYASVFQTVEVNNTFYRLPESGTFAAWRSDLPAGFVMAVKASRYLTHLKRLREPEEPIDRLLGRAVALGPRLGPVLFQLPGNFQRDTSRLSAFLEALPEHLPNARRGRRRRLQAVMEFRHPSWYVRETYDLLDAHDVALCLHDRTGSAIDRPLLGPFVYVRFHGRSGAYSGRYDGRTLRGWAGRLARAILEGRHVYAYFNNDIDGAAVEDARRLSRMVREELAGRRA